MNTFVESANSLAGAWTAWLWPTIWQSAVLTAAIFLITLMLRNKMASLRFCLWMLIPLRLIVMPFVTIALPVLPQQPTPVIGANESSLQWTISTNTTPVESTEYAEEMPFAQVDNTANPVSAPAARIDIWAVLMAVWLIGVALGLIRLIAGWRKMRSIAARAEPIDDLHVLDIVRDTASSLRLHRIPRVVLTDREISPFVFGILRPCVVLPKKLAHQSSREALSAVIAHEFAHVRKLDPLTGWILAICELLYFFHPVFHFAKRKILIEREKACDECVLAIDRTKRTTYADALIDAAAVCRTLSPRIAPAAVVAESFTDLKKRLIAIATNPKPKAALSTRAFILLILTAIICVPGVTLAQTNRPLSGRELLRARQRKDGQEGSTKRPSASKLMDNFVANRECFRSFMAKCETSTKYKGTFTNNVELQKYSKHTASSDGIRASDRTYFWGQINPTFQATEEKANYNSGLWDGRDYYQYTRSTIRTPNARGHVIIRLNSEDSRRPRHAATIECFPGSIPLGHLPGTIERVDSIIRKADSVSVRDSMEKIGNSDCYVIEAKAKTGSYTLWIDPAHGYLIAKAQIRKGAGDDIGNGYVLPKNDNVSIYLKNVRFKKIDNAWFPVEAEYGRSRNTPKGSYSTQSSHYTLEEIVLNPDHDELGSFVPGDILDKAKVRVLKGNTHTEIGKYTWQQDGKMEDSQGQKLTIDDIRAKVFDQPDSPQLVTRVYDISTLIRRPPEPEMGGMMQMPGGFSAMDPNLIEKADAKGVFTLRIDEFCNTIKETVEPNSWSHVGGAGAIEVYEKRKLVIRQTPEVHKKIEKILAELRNTENRTIQIEARFIEVTEDFLDETAWIPITCRN